jgi:hypothetical protein
MKVLFLLSVWICGFQQWTSLLRRPLLIEAVPLMEGLADPAQQPIFVNQARNALDPRYIMTPQANNPNSYTVGMGKSTNHGTGLVKDGVPVQTTIFGYSDENGDGRYR